MGQGERGAVENNSNGIELRRGRRNDSSGDGGVNGARELIAAWEQSIVIYLLGIMSDISVMDLGESVID
jgi:hypothetical protein